MADLTCQVTLEQMLEAREKRAEKQLQLIEQYKMPLVSVTVNMPGVCKRTPLSVRIFRDGFRELMDRLATGRHSPAFQEAYEPVTGPEGLVAVDMDLKELKDLALRIETGHPLGRLLDFDVIGKNGQALSREELGYPKRKCLLCDGDAHACARSRAHSTEELVKKIQDMAEGYFGA